MVSLEYFDGNKWIPAGGSFGNEMIAWVSLGDDNINYRTVNTETREVLTNRSIKKSTKCKEKYIKQHGCHGLISALYITIREKYKT